MDIYVVTDFSPLAMDNFMASPRVSLAEVLSCETGGFILDSTRFTSIL